MVKVIVNRDMKKIADLELVSEVIFLLHAKINSVATNGRLAIQLHIRSMQLYRSYSAIVCWREMKFPMGNLFNAKFIFRDYIV